MQEHRKRQNIIFLGVIFILSTVFWGVLCDYAKKTVIYPDELYYLDIARNLFKGNGFMVRNLPSTFQKILYPIFIMPSFLFVSHMRAIAWINALVMSSTVFPAYFLARKIMRKDYLVYMVVVLVVTLSIMLNCQYVMSEVAFYPVSMWVFYFVYCFFEAEEHKKKVLYSILVGISFYLAYLNKEIALYFLISYSIVFFFSCFIFHMDKKKDILYLGIVYMVFCMLFFICKVTVFSGMEQFYQLKSSINLFVFDRLISLGYYMLYNLCYAIIGFGIIIILVPLISLDRADKKIWKMTFFMLGALVVACATITYKISVREDFGNAAVQLHLRYIEPMIIPFLILTIAFFEKREYKIQRHIYGKGVKVFALFSLAFMIVANRIITVNIVEHSVLKVYGIVIRGITRIAQHFDTLHYLEEVGLNLVRVMIIVCSFIVLYLLFNKGKMGIKVFIVCFFFINIANIVFGYRDNKPSYMITEEYEQQLIQANSYLSKLKGNIVFVSKGSVNVDKQIIDTYINCPVFVTSVDLMEGYGYLEDGCVDLATEKIISDLSQSAYDISTADYILASKGVMIKKEEFEKIDDFQLDGYLLYKNNDPSRIFVQPFFPVQPGAVVDVLAEDNVFMSLQDLPEKYCSTAGGQPIVYGPYQKIYKGNYEITLEYSCDQSVSENGCVGLLEVGKSGQENFVVKELASNSEKLVINNIEVMEDTDQCEIRVISKVAGLRFKAIHIKRIA